MLDVHKPGAGLSSVRCGECSFTQKAHDHPDFKMPFLGYVLALNSVEVFFLLPLEK